MKKLIVKILAKILPDYCPTQVLFGFSICKLNPWYEEVIDQKLRNMGYGND